MPRATWGERVSSSRCCWRRTPAASSWARRRSRSSSPSTARSQRGVEGRAVGHEIEDPEGRSPGVGCRQGGHGHSGASIPRVGLDGTATSRFGIRPGQEGLPAGLHRETHRGRHRHRLPGLGEGGVHQDAVHSLFHRQAGVRRGPDPGVHDHRHRKPALDGADAVRIEQPEPAADRRGERHHGDAARLFEAKRGDQVVVGVGHHLEPLGGQGPGGREQPLGVGEQRLPVADHLELDEVVESSLAAQPGVADCFVGGVTAGGVGQEEEPGGIEVIENPLFLAPVEVDPPHRHRDDLGTRGIEGGHHLDVGPVLTGAHQEARAEAPSADGEREVSGDECVGGGADGHSSGCGGPGKIIEGWGD